MLKNILPPILLVEDDEVDVMNVQRAFKKNHIGNDLIIAGNGVEALELLLADSPKRLSAMPKIVLLDINMPKMNGLELLKILRADDELKKLSVFMLTTSNEERDKIEAYNLNVAGYIIKPVNFESFIDAIKKLNAFWNLIEYP